MKLIVVTLVLLPALFVSSSALAAQSSITITLDEPQLEGGLDRSAATSRSADSSPSVKAERPSAEAAPTTSGRKPTNGVTIGRVGVVTAAKAKIHRSRSSRRILAACSQGTPLGIVNEKGAWYGVMMIDMSTGWIHKNDVKLLDYNIVATNHTYAAGGGQGQRIVQASLRYVGVPYVWGGGSWSGLDCSGFVKTVYDDFGITLPRVSRDQASVGAPVAWNDLQPGDRLYFACKGPDIDHCGIYMGSGLFIHSSSRRGGVAVDNLASGLFSRTLVAARRS